MASISLSIKGISICIVSKTTIRRLKSWTFRYNKNHKYCWNRKTVWRHRLLPWTTRPRTSRNRNRHHDHVIMYLTSEITTITKISSYTNVLKYHGGQINMSKMIELKFRRSKISFSTKNIYWTETNGDFENFLIENQLFF